MVFGPGSVPSSRLLHQITPILASPHWLPGHYSSFFLSLNALMSPPRSASSCCPDRGDEASRFLLLNYGTTCGHVLVSCPF